jgi:hypothetical protein
MIELIKSIACGICKALGGCEDSAETEPTPEPELEPTGTIDINLMSSILLDKLEEMGDESAELYLADKQCKVYSKEVVKAFLGLDETDKITYVAEDMDCDDFAAMLFGMGLGLLWTAKHAMNFFISDDEEVYFVEPQTDKISHVLEDWQGLAVRSFLSR